MSNDRHKFRVAVKQGLEWQIYDVLNILFKNDGTIWVQTIRESESATFTAWMLVDGENVILEQCTGLTDRHNKLIYENDVVDMYIPYEDNHRKCVVRYVIDEGTAQWLAVYLEGKRPHRSMGICYDITSEYLDGSYCTVIGTIHEDQFREVTELVEGEQC